MKLWSFFLLILLANTVIFARAQEEEEDSKDVQKTASPEVTLTASPFVSTALVFPNAAATKEFVIGGPIKAVLGFTNAGEKDLNVTTVTASLRHPSDWRYYVQNFTKVIYNRVVPAGQQASLLYMFMPDPLLEPRDFGLTLNVFYHDAEGGNFTSNFFNSTVVLKESTESIDAQTLFSYVGLIGVAGLVGFIVYKAVKSFGKKGHRRSRVETGTTKNVEVDNEWLEGTHAVVGSPRSPKGRRVTRRS
jgi:hypothetical protein